MSPSALPLRRGPPATRVALTGTPVENRLTRGSVQLRLGTDGQWYRLVRSGSGWDLAAAPDPDPVALLAPAR